MRKKVCRYTFIFFSCGSTAKFWALAASMKLFRFISVTRSRTVSSAPWTGDQLVARTPLTAPGDCGDDDDDEVGGMNGFGWGNRNTWRKPAPDATLSTTNPTCQTRARTQAAAVGSQRPTTSAMARPVATPTICKYLHRRTRKFRRGW
jgi:hypothetical protein